MRVQDSNPIGLTSSMGKKKQRLRKSERQNSETSDEGAADVQCSHITKSVNINQVRKAIKHSTVLGRCQLCNASNDSLHKKPARNEASAIASADSLIPADELPPEYEPSVFFCLQCGHQGCDRYSPDKHALQHFETTTQSTAHNIVLNMMSYQVWCYACDNFIPVDASKKLLECADFVYHNAGHKDSITSFVKRADFIKENGFSLESAFSESPNEGDAIVKDDLSRPKVAPITQATSGVLLAFPRVKGLNNLGNTCFFNAVVQNLGQTHLLESLLRDLCQKGCSIDLSVCLQESDSRPCSDDETNEKEQDSEQKLESLSLNLGECGTLTQSLINLFDEMKTSNKQNSVSPSALFGQVCKKAPRFKGFQQQDSHELLRYLLDAIKGEETKRTQLAILKAFKRSDKESLKEIPDELRSKIKAFGQRAKQTFIDNIFGGHFISTVVCQACDTHHQIFEPFLDLSLPVIEEKSFKSCGPHGCKAKDYGKGLGICMDDNEEHSGASKQSKHMSKKERRMAKKNASKGKRASGKTEKQSQAKNAKGSSLVNSSPTDPKGEEEEEEVGKTDDAQCSNELSVKDEGNTVEEDENDGGLDDKNDEVKSSALLEAGRDGCQETDTVTNAELRNLSLESESSDADVEDNEESDASRYRGMVNSIDALPAGDYAEEEHKETNENGFSDEHKCSDNLNRNGIDRTSNATYCGGVSHEGVEYIANGIDSLRVRKDSTHEEEALLADRSSTATPGDDSLKHEVFGSARKVAMKTLVPREKPSGQECSVLASLYQFTSPELLSGNNMYRCSVCNRADRDGKAMQGQKPVFTCASKQFLIYTPPAVLTLHLKRFQQVGFNLRKITRHIEFSELLDIAPYCSTLCQNIQAGQRRILYSLYGIVEHSGTLRSGHYTAYVKVRHSNPGTKRFLQSLITGHPSIQRLVDAMQNASADARGMVEPSTDTAEDVDTKHVVPPLGKWYYISDSTVNEVRNISNLLNCQAYLLFYERIE